MNQFSKLLQGLCAALAVVLLAAAFMFTRDIAGLAACGINALFWLLAAWLKKNWLGSISFTLTVITAGYTYFLKIPPLLPLGAVVLALAAWDLGRFTQVVSRVTPREAADRLEIIHLRRLALALAAGTAAGLLSIAVQIKLSFGLALVLALAVFILFSLGVNEIIRTSQPDRD